MATPQRKGHRAAPAHSHHARGSDDEDVDMTAAGAGAGAAAGGADSSEFAAALASVAVAKAPFCPMCGKLLRMPDTNPIRCDACDFACNYQDLNTLEIVTTSKQRPAPAWLLEEDLLKEARKHRATVEEECPKCRHPRLSYYTMQMRSADEGQTVFYECEKCGFTYSTNT